MVAGSQTAPTRARVKRAVQQVLEDNLDDDSSLQILFEEVLTETLRSSLKEVVKEAIQEVEEESATTGRQRGRKLVYFGLGVALGYLAASGRLPAEQRETVVEEARSRLPIGPEEDGEQQDESDDEQTQYGGGTQDIDAAEQTDRITGETGDEDSENGENTNTE